MIRSTHLLATKPVCVEARLLARIACALLMGAAQATSAQPVTAPGFPLHHLRLIIPYPPGGGFDGLFRPLAERMGQVLGQPIVVDNVAGGNGMIGTEQLLHVPADGYTLLAGGDNIASAPYVVKGIRWDPLRDFAPVAHVAGTPRGIAVHPALPANDIRELIALSRTRSLNYATASVGSGPYMIVESLAFEVGLQVTHIPYKGNGLAVQALMAGEVDLTFVDTSSIMPLVRSGAVRALMVTGHRSIDGLAGVPWFDSLYPGRGIDAWHGLFGPAGMASDVVERIAADVRAVLGSSDLSRRFREMGFEPTGRGPAEFTAIVRRDDERWGAVIRANGIRGD